EVRAARAVRGVALRPATPRHRRQPRLPRRGRNRARGHGRDRGHRSSPSADRALLGPLPPPGDRARDGRRAHHPGHRTRPLLGLHLGRHPARVLRAALLRAPLQAVHARGQRPVHEDRAQGAGEGRQQSGHTTGGAHPMNRFEQAVYDCMIPTAELLEQTTNPLHRAMLLNFWRHVHLEGAGDYERIVAPDMMVDEPVYRVTWGANPAVISGKDGVLAFYNSVGDSVLWHSDDRLAVADWGICDELTFHQLAR